jgi:hypothetical protein
MMNMSRVQAHSNHAQIMTSSSPRIERCVASWTLWLLSATVLVPHVEVGGIAVGFDDACAAFLLILFAGYFFQKRTNLLFRREWLLITFLWSTIIISGIVFSILGGLFYINKFHLPTEMWQYVKRMLFFYCTCYISYRYLVSSGDFYRCLQYVLLIAFLIGIFQILPWSIGDHLAGLYARSERQLLGVEKLFAQLRNYGVAGFSTAWGGFAVFGISVSLGGLLAQRERHVKRPFSRPLLWIVLVLAFINTLFSGSRAATAALLAVYLVSILFGFFRTRRKLHFLLTYVVGSALICTGLIYALWDKVLFIFFRVGALIDQSGGSRVNQIETALSILRDGQSWLFGVGNVTQRTLASSFGTEVEPVYLLVNYGILGMTLRYGLLLIIFIYAWRQLKHSEGNDQDLAMTTILSLTGYAVFSLGYFFYQELYVGMLPWLLFGWTVGSYYRVKHLRLGGRAGAN